jgi:hypothetical protein
MIEPGFEFTISHMDKPVPRAYPEDESIRIKDVVRPEYLYTQETEDYKDLPPTNLKLKMVAHSEACAGV